MILESALLKSWRLRVSDHQFRYLTYSSDASDYQQIASTVCAMLNGCGGTVVVEIIDNKNRGATIEGFLYGYLYEKIVPFPTIESRGYEYDSDGNRVSIHVIEIPLGTEKPYSWADKIYVFSSNNSLKLANSSEIVELIGEYSDPNERWERQIVHNAAFKDLIAHQVDKFCHNEFVQRDLRHRNDRIESDGWSILEHFNLGKRPLLRNSAIILFGEKPTKYFPQAAVRAIAYHTEEHTTGSIIDDRTCEDNLFKTIDDCLNFLDRNLSRASDFPTPSDSSFARSTKKGVLPFLAIREVLLNSLVHRDFSAFDGVVSIRIFPKRIEIWNPGELPKGFCTTDIESIRVSRPRNPDIAHVLHKAGFIERIGSGINRAVTEISKAGLRRPIWEEVAGGVRVTLYLEMDQSPDSLSDLQKKIVKLLSGGEVLKSTTISKLIDKSHDSSFEIELHDLVASGRIIRKDSGYSIA